MSNKRRITAVILSLIMVLTMIPVSNTHQSVRAATTEFKVTSPKDNALIGAGYFDIKWNPATNGTVKQYEVFVDGESKGTTTDTTYEYYTTYVKMYSVRITVEYTDGTVETTPESYFSITKKGVCIDNRTNMGKKFDPSKLTVGWYYNWGTDPTPYSAYKGYEFVPMIWGRSSADDISNKVTEFSNKGYKYVLGFNEPDLEGQAFMSVNEVIGLWPSFMNKGINVGSPATALWPDASKTWFQPFMNRINASTTLDVDFIAIHCYPDNFQGEGMAEWFLKTVVDETWQKYHKPIWITEFSTSGDKITEQGTIDFLKNVMPGLDERRYVERYSFFSFNAAESPAGLWNHDTGELTEAGRVYNELGNPEGYEPSKPETPEYIVDQEENSKQLFADSVSIKNVQCRDYIKEDGVSATASSSNGGNTADKTIDDDIGTRWESIHKVDPQNLTINLGKTRNIKQVKISWEAASAKDYVIQVADRDDESSYKTVAKIENASNNRDRIDTITLSNMANGRYIRIKGTARTTGYGYSIWDIAVYGTDDMSVNEPITEEATTKKPVIKPVPPETTTEKVKQTQKPTQKATEKVAGENLTQYESEVTKLEEQTTVANENAIGTNANISKTKIKKATKKRSAKKILIKLKKISNISGYSVAISTSKKFTKKKTIIKNYRKANITFKSAKLKRNTRYYVKARAYRITGRKIYYGAWTKGKKVIVKK